MSGKDEIPVVRLKNGAEEAVPMVRVLYAVLSHLARKNPIALYELYQLCLNSRHEVWGSKTLPLLKDLALVEKDGTVHDSVRNVVMSAVKLEEGDISLYPPEQGK